MNRSEFREKHGERIEYYPYIEMSLKGICAVILADESMGTIMTHLHALQV